MTSTGGATGRPPRADDPVVLDLGGVLLDWDPRHLYRTLIVDEAERERFLAEVVSPAWNLEQDRGRPWDEAVALLAAQFPQHPEYAALIAAHHHRWRETIRGPVPGTEAVVDELHAQGTPLYALTNFSAEKFALVREEFAFFRRFRGWVVSGEERLVKPDPALYAVLLDRFGLEAARTAYVDDSPPNVAAAAALGMTALRFTDAPTLRRELAELGWLPPGATSAPSTAADREDGGS